LGLFEIDRIGSRALKGLVMKAFVNRSVHGTSSSLWSLWNVSDHRLVIGAAPLLLIVALQSAFAYGRHLFY
jgi:hypothetical protein